MNKQLFLLFALLILSFTLYSQDFSKIDSIVYSYPIRYKHPKKLADQIAKDFNTDIEKAMAVYSWITKNISYSYKELWKNNSDYNKAYYATQDNYYPSYYSSNYVSYSKSSRSGFKKHLKTEKKYREKISKKVISKGHAVCEGYSQLFKNTCDYLNISCFYVVGKSKTEISNIGNVKSSNHAWNIVEINFKKYLIDATWGAGSYDHTNHKFTSKPDTFYFGTDPKIFIKKHYPDFYGNSLLKEQISPEEFSNSPLYYSNKKSSIFNIIKPANGVLYRESQQVLFTYEQTIHSITYKLDDKEFIYNKEIEYNEGEIGLKFDLSNTKAKELVIFFDHTMVIGFKIE